jgi:TetR/AcrR family transcriptional repressor of mexJK operon
MESLQPFATQTPKVHQILNGAKQVFLELGYEGTSVEAIARRAKVSKGTLYNYFPDKRALFTAVVEGECHEQAQRIFQIERNGEAIATVLYQIALNYVTFLVSPFAQSIFRIAIAEAQRFPALGHTFYRSGPELGTHRLIQFFNEAVARGELVIDNPELAAHQFIELCKADLFYKCLLSVKSQVSPSEIERIASGAVETFLKAFGR